MDSLIYMDYINHISTIKYMIITEFICTCFTLMLNIRQKCVIFDMFAGSHSARLRASSRSCSSCCSRTSEQSQCHRTFVASFLSRDVLIENMALSAVRFVLSVSINRTSRSQACRHWLRLFLRPKHSKTRPWEHQKPCPNWFQLEHPPGTGQRPEMAAVISRHLADLAV